MKTPEVARQEIWAHSIVELWHGRLIGKYMNTSAGPAAHRSPHAIVKAAVDYVPSAEHAGISLVERGKIRTVAPTSGNVWSVAVSVVGRRRLKAQQAG